MAKNSIGLIELGSIAAGMEVADAMLKAANVKFRGWKKVGSGLCTAFVGGDVAAVRAATDAGAAAAKAMGGEIISVHVIPRPHDELATILPK